MPGQAAPPQWPVLGSPPGPRMLVAVHLPDLSRLREQLSAETLEGLLEQFTGLLERTAHSYAASLEVAADGVFVLVLSGAEDDLPMQALCCAQLLCLLLEQINQRRADHGEPVFGFGLGVVAAELGAGSQPGLRQLAWCRFLEEAARCARRAEPGVIVLSQVLTSLPRLKEVTRTRPLPPQEGQPPVAELLWLGGEWQELVAEQARQLGSPGPFPDSDSDEKPASASRPPEGNA